MRNGACGGQSNDVYSMKQNSMFVQCDFLKCQAKKSSKKSEKLVKEGLTNKKNCDIINELSGEPSKTEAERHVGS